MVESIPDYWILNQRLDKMFIKLICSLFSEIEIETEPIKYGFVEHYTEWKRQTTDLAYNLPMVSFKKWWNKHIIETKEKCVLHLKDVVKFVNKNYKNNRIDKKVIKQLFGENTRYRGRVVIKVIQYYKVLVNYKIKV